MDDKQDRESLFEKHRENIYFRWGLTAFVVIVACVVVAEIVMNLSSVAGAFRGLLRTMTPVFYGLGIAYLLDPIVGRLQLVLRPRLAARLKRPENAEGLSRGLGVLIALLLLILILWALLSMVLPQLLESLTAIVRNLPVYYNTLRDWVTGLISNNVTAADLTGDIMETVYGYFSNWLSTSLLPRVQEFMVTLTTSVVGMARALLNLVLGLIISVYLLMGKDKFLAQGKKLCYAVLGVKRGGYVCNVCTYANQAFGGFIGGKIIDSLIIGVLCFIGLSLMRMPYTMLISIIVCVTNIIPFFGPYLGAVPSALLLLVINPMQALYFIIFILILQQLDGNVIGPMILGDATGLGGFWVVVSILVFGSFYGVLGMIIAVPLTAVLLKIATEIVNRVLRNRGLSTASDDYRAWDYPPRPDMDRWYRKRNRRRRIQWRAGLQALRDRKKPAPPAEAGEEQDEP